MGRSSTEPRARGRGQLRRLDFDSGATETIYTTPDRRTHLSDFDVGGGRVAIETVSTGMRLLAMDNGGENVEQLAAGATGTGSADAC